eukprot:TRINITY_DN5766_c0_g1_i1.p1 TRINITY_DN5766_c0_g1~~TRINITY_DN5766_c0_g1_i1.p1  ORF type:complete len:193 (-),score=32.80 TRINITY_DN5766_c0_g1_i1:89-667(-)
MYLRVGIRPTNCFFVVFNTTTPSGNWLFRLWRKDGKCLRVKKKHVAEAHESHTLVELAVYLHGNKGGPLCLVFPLSENLPILETSKLQEKALVKALNYVNYKSQKVNTLIRFKERSQMIVCPYVFVLLYWSERNGKYAQQHQRGKFKKLVRSYLDISFPFMSQLYEAARSPACLGLRGLIINYNEVFGVSGN